jgi:hypothetical protein
MNRKVRTLYLQPATGLSVYCRGLQVQGPHEMIAVLREPDLMDENNGEKLGTNVTYDWDVIMFTK